MAKKPSKGSHPSHEELGKMLQNIYDSGYVDRNTMFKMSFLKGVAAGLGGVVGATIVVTLLIWVLSLFDRVPLLGPLTEKIEDTVQTQTKPQQ